jgi:regulator of sigma E protease
MLTTILATVVVLGVLIFVHELGHFLAAKAVDIEVLRFSIGFGPTLLGFTRGETEYVISAVPLGGYVKMAGMVEEEMIGPLEGGVEEGREPSPRDFDAKPLWARFLVIIAGVAMNGLFAVAAFTASSKVNGIMVPVITDVAEGSPAEVAGILPGDLVVAVNGIEVPQTGQLIGIIQQSAGDTVVMSIDRDGEQLSLKAVPWAKNVYIEAAHDSVEIGVIGVTLGGEQGYRELGWGASLQAGAQETWFWVAQIGTFGKRLFTGKSSARELGGPILIGELSGQAARLGFWAMLNFMALISVNLAVLNLLPIPVLDGGHLVFLTVEGLRGRPVSPESRIRLTQVGLLLVMGLMVWAFANDILRLIGI